MEKTIINIIDKDEVIDQIILTRNDLINYIDFDDMLYYYESNSLIFSLEVYKNNKLINELKINNI